MAHSLGVDPSLSDLESEARAAVTSVSGPVCYLSEPMKATIVQNPMVDLPRVELGTSCMPCRRSAS